MRRWQWLLLLYVVVLFHRFLPLHPLLCHLTRWRRRLHHIRDVVDSILNTRERSERKLAKFSPLSKLSVNVSKSLCSFIRSNNTPGASCSAIIYANAPHTAERATGVIMRYAKSDNSPGGEGCTLASSLHTLISNAIEVEILNAAR